MRHYAQVRLGDHDLSVTGETTIAEKTVAVAKINNHESYAPAGGSLNNDITVLELAEEVDINIYTPACLAQTSDTTTFDGKTMLHDIQRMPSLLRAFSECCENDV